MGEKELRAKYGGKLAKAINRAIRAEIPEGNAALDRLTTLAGPAKHSGWKLPDGSHTPAAAEYYKHKKLIDRLEMQIRKAWGIPLETPAIPQRNASQRPNRSKPSRPRSSRPKKRFGK